ncbi:XRE family transcriptional regulator [Vibrio owensii]|uniref:XRE family transcriptional regulator n=1 Tax=Vibrio owensii TaxID=696485 RepID=UPI00390A4986
MSYNFERELAIWLKEKSITRKELIALLQQAHYEEFKGLDVITLSRWLNGKVIPPLYKQFYIARCLDADLVEIILNLDEDEHKKPARHSSVLASLIKAFDFSLTALSYFKVPESIRSEIRSQTYYAHLEAFKDFYSNVSAIEGFVGDLYAMKTDIKYKCILLQNKQDDIVGHWAGILNLEKLNNLPSFISIPENELKQSCLVKLGHAMNSTHFFELVTQAICYYLLSLYKTKDYVYIFIAGYPILEFAKKVFNAKEVKYYPPTDNSQKVGLYLVKFDIIRSISNPILIPKIKKKLQCLQECDSNACNLCNLRQFCSSQSKSCPV